ncbi:hypothetical protein TrLO_g6104 [Triparma laevis f. longispina]|uniref:Uncharacterized protein n=1 Tax=Triparma laevis f. longispina TaxID=1714387 RepID=A0A9W7CEM4_9STRA|nr:hypothetical protein TrLO_g6104 [Triparma laevis f. longispina]
MRHHILIAEVITKNEFYSILSIATLPFVMLTYVGTFMCQPKRRNSRDKWLSRLHFRSYFYMIEAAWIIKEYRRGSMTKIGVHIGLTVACTLLFHFGLKLRANVGRLPLEDLEPFLVDTLFKGGLRTLLTLLFLFFRTKCWFEEGVLATCANVSWCSSMLSTYAILWWSVGLVQGSVKRRWRHDLNLSIDKIARMKDISLRRGVGGFLTTVTGLCGIFLFSMISADEMDDTTITVVGAIGGVAILGVVISEIYSSLLRQK